MKRFLATMFPAATLLVAVLLAGPASSAVGGRWACQPSPAPEGYQPEEPNYKPNKPWQRFAVKVDRYQGTTVIVLCEYHPIPDSGSPPP